MRRTFVWLIRFPRDGLRILCATLALSVVGSTASGGVGQWKNYTDMKGVTSIACTENDVWAATHGGLFRLQLSDSSFTTLTNSEGLTDNDLTAILVDDLGKVWVGTSSGAIDVFDPVSETWQHILDIVVSGKARKGITGFFQSGDSIFIASDFGVSLFLRSRGEFRETYGKFGPFPSSIRVNAFVSANGMLWVATASGLASAERSNPNLSAPSAWTTYTTSDGLPSNNVAALAFFDGSIYAGTGAGLSRLSGSGWERVQAFGSNGISQLLPIGDRLYVATGTDLYSWGVDGAATKVGESLPGVITAAAEEGSGNVVIGVEANGLAFLNGTVWSFKFPNGPGSNSFVSLKLDATGVLFAASGSTNGKGFYGFDLSAPPGMQWKNYNVQVNPVLQSDNYYRVSLGQDDSKWISSWGNGVARLDADGVLSVFDKKTAGFGGIQEDTNYVVIGDVVPDRRGNTWMTVRSASNQNVIAVFRPDSTWFFLQNGLNPNTTLLTSIAVDQFDTKWIVSEDASLPGLLYLRDGGTLTNPNDDVWSILTADHGLSSNTVTRLVVDRDGELWVGTNLGLNIVVNPASPKAQQAVRRVFIAFDQYINDIAADPTGNKWVGTKEGVFVLSPDGTSLVAQYTVENTGGKLTDNDVRAVAFDDKRGIAYIGTGKGLSALTTTAVAPVENFGDLLISPNPFSLPSTRDLQIDGLVRDSNIKIVTIDGRLVRDFSSPGGRVAFWDGRDESGRYVPSGVYIVVASSTNGEEVAKGKVAVLRN
jgi:ligand-binding sensor domain-containing protein